MNRFTATKISLTAFVIAITAVGAFASNTGQDNASNMPYQPGNSWNSGDNGGIGFGAWSFGNTIPTNGFAGEYVGGTGDGNPAFGLFASHSGDNGSSSNATATASRSFTGGSMTAGQTFSMNLGIGNGVDTGGVVGFNLLSGATPEFTFKFTGGQSVWQLNDGGSDFNTTIPFSSGTPINFAFTYDGGNNYDLLITEGATIYTATGFTATDSISNIDGFKLFDTGQGSGNNIGFNLLSVPEPSTWAMGSLTALGLVGSAFRRFRRVV